MVIAIDGPAGAGKSTLAKMLANRLGFLYVDTGAMYRALTLKAINLRIPFSDTKSLVELACKTQIRLEKTAKNNIRVWLDEDDVTQQIRKPAVTNAVFNIAGVPDLRQIMVSWQREYARQQNIVMEGRDIGTIVFPEAEVKFYLDATVRVRAQRRFAELKEKGVDVKFDAVLGQIKDRDNKDKTRNCGPLKISDDAIYIDTTNLNIEQVLARLLKYIKDEKKK